MLSFISRVQRMKRSVEWQTDRLGLTELYFRSLSRVRYGFGRFNRSRHPLPGRLIVSLTSYPPRFASLHLTLRTLLAQDMAPDLVVLWLYSPDVAELPLSVRKMTGSRLEIRTVDQDLKSFKKLIPALSTFPDSYIVTADDDTYYQRSWLRHLVASCRPGSREVVGHVAHKITLNEARDIRPYREWELRISGTAAGPRVFLTGVGGILYPPGAFAPEVLDAKTFMELCPTADDVWFYFMLRRNQFTSRKIAGSFPRHSWRRTQEQNLFEANMRGGNDLAINALVSRFGKPFVSDSSD
jgi:hypothetical protein